MTARYYSSRHPDVLAAMEENTYRYMAFSEAVTQWALSRHATALYVLTPTGVYISGLTSQPPPAHGEWVDCDGVWRPAPTNRRQAVLMDALGAEWVAVPGLPATALVRGSAEPSKPFLADDPVSGLCTAWVGYSYFPRGAVPDRAAGWMTVGSDAYRNAKASLKPPLRFDWEGLV